jgi:hypothetical protein
MRVGQRYTNFFFQSKVLLKFRESPEDNRNNSINGSSSDRGPKGSTKAAMFSPQ